MSPIRRFRRQSPAAAPKSVFPVPPEAPQTAEPVALPRALEDLRLERAGIRWPKVSLIVTSHNYDGYIVDCLRSVARQTYPEWECVIVDDCSTDATVARVREFLDGPESGGRFRLLERQVNGGQMEAFRDGLAVTDGPFVVMLDADDVLLEDFLEAHMQAHTAVRTVAFTSTNQYQIDATGAVVGGEHMDHQSKGFYRHVRQTSFQKGFWGWATSSSMVFRRAALNLILPRDGTTFRICADYYIAHFCHLVGDSLLVPTIHGCYRRHGHNNFGSNLIIGNINSVGNLDKHPPHDLFRQTMIRHILSNYEMFYAIFMGKGLVALLMRLVLAEELPELVRDHPRIFPDALASYQMIYQARVQLRETLPVSEKFRIVEVRAGRSAHFT